MLSLKAILTFNVKDSSSVLTQMITMTNGNNIKSINLTQFYPTSKIDVKSTMIVGGKSNTKDTHGNQILTLWF